MYAVPFGNYVALTLAGLVAGLAIVQCTDPAAAQTQCWAVPNGVNNTIQCANGFWRTITPEGEEFTGAGMTDPNASAAGSNLVINGPKLGPQVTPPTQVLPMLEPYQAGSFGFQPRQD
jgi:hypothetical protein